VEAPGPQPSDQVLSKESLNTVVNAHASDVHACYDAALEVWPGIKGRMATSFVIWFDGQVALARTGETTQRLGFVVEGGLRKDSGHAGGFRDAFVMARIRELEDGA
jgi:hypothetical protein